MYIYTMIMIVLAVINLFISIEEDPCAKAFRGP